MTTQNYMVIFGIVILSLLIISMILSFKSGGNSQQAVAPIVLTTSQIATTNKPIMLTTSQIAATNKPVVVTSAPAPVILTTSKLIATVTPVSIILTTSPATSVPQVPVNIQGSWTISFINNNFASLGNISVNQQSGSNIFTANGVSGGTINGSLINFNGSTGQYSTTMYSGKKVINWISGSFSGELWWAAD